MHRKSVSLLLVLVASLATALLLAPAAWGQGIDIPMLVTGEQDQNTWVTAAYAHQFNTDVDDSDTEFARDNAQLVLGHRAKVGDELFLVTHGAYMGGYYDFDDGRADGYVWNDIHRGLLALGVGWENDDWNIVGLLIGRTDGESGAHFGDTLTGGGAVALSYKWSDTLRTGFILGAMSRLEDTASIIPVPTVDWRFAERWNLHFGLVVAAAYPGVGPEIGYQGEHWSFGFGGSFQTRRFRLEEHENSPADEGIGEERSFPVFGRVGYAPNKNLSFGVTAGAALGGEIRSGTEGGTKISKEDYDAAPILGLNIRYLF